MSTFMDHEVWKNKEFVRKYIEDFRGAIPYALDHIEIMLEAIQMAAGEVKNFADIGCGNGILAGAILLKHPEARGTLVDFYEPVLKEAKHQLSEQAPNLTFVTADLMDPKWTGKIKKYIPFDVVVSGFTIHHFPDKRKKELYAEIFNMLEPGGIFINIEHVAPESKLIDELSNKVVMEHLGEFHKKRGGEKTPETIRKEYMDDFSDKGNILAPCRTQLEWLREIGFSEVSVFFKAYVAAVFGGVKPG